MKFTVTIFLATCSVAHAMKKLSTQVNATKIQFLQLLKDDEYPLDNIAILFFLKTFRFLFANIRQNCLTDQKQRDFGKQVTNVSLNFFLHLNKGPKNANEIKDGITQKGCVSTDSAKTNFNIPSVNVQYFSTSHIYLSGPLRLDNSKTYP